MPDDPRAFALYVRDMAERIMAALTDGKGYTAAEWDRDAVAVLLNELHAAATREFASEGEG